jgi:hypothetical protein
MQCDSRGSKRVSGGLLWAGAAACLVVAGCSEIHPAPNEEGGGIIDSPTQEQDQFHQEEEDAQRGGGGRR